MEYGFNLEERHYAQHKFPSDIWVAEYELASKKLDAEEKAFLWATNITTILAPLLWFFGYRIHLEWTDRNLPSEALPMITTIFLLFSVLFSLMSLFHVANSRKSRVLAERKVVVLRRAQGVRYGDRQLILPSWRIEGADNPFGLRLYPGLFSYSSFAIFLLSGFPALSIALLFDNVPLGPFSPKKFEFAHPSQWAMCVGLLFFVLGFFVFRLNLREQNENYILWLSKFIAFIVRIPLVPNVEYKLYRCKLEIAEASRVGVPMEEITSLALSIEDKLFFQHKGVSLRGVARAFWQYVRRGRKSGGSTITQQCARTNFLVRLSPPLRRKFVEICLAKWPESIASKEEILQIYLTTARFDKGVHGFHRAKRHYFPDEGDLDRAMAFILIERLGNAKSSFLVGRIRQLLKRLESEEKLCPGDVSRVGNLYGKMIASGAIKKENM